MRPALHCIQLFRVNFMNWPMNETCQISLLGSRTNFDLNMVLTYTWLKTVLVSVNIVLYVIIYGTCFCIVSVSTLNLLKLESGQPYLLFYERREQPTGWRHKWHKPRYNGIIFRMDTNSWDCKRLKIMWSWSETKMIGHQVWRSMNWKSAITYSSCMKDFKSQAHLWWNWMKFAVLSFLSKFTHNF